MYFIILKTFFLLHIYCTENQNYEWLTVIAASVEALGLKPIFDILEKIGFLKEPPFGNNVSALDVSTIAGVAQRILGQNLLVNLYISEDVSDTTKNRIMVN